MSWSELQALLVKEPSRPEQDTWGAPPAKARHVGPGRQWRDLQSLLTEQPPPRAETDVWGTPPVPTPHAPAGGRWRDLQNRLTEPAQLRRELDMWGSPPVPARRDPTGGQWADLQSLLAEPVPWKPERDMWGAPPAATRRGGDGRWWDDLRAYLDRTQARPVAGAECPNDGSLLLPRPDGRLWCPFDGWQGRPDEAAPAGPGVPTTTTDDPYLPAYESTY